MMLPCALIPERSLRQRGAWSHFVRKDRSLIPEFADERELGHKMASRLQTQARRRASVWAHQEADITTIEHKVSFGYYRTSDGVTSTSAFHWIVLKKSKIERRQKSRKCQFLDGSVAQMPRSADTKLHGRFSEK